MRIQPAPPRPGLRGARPVTLVLALLVFGALLPPAIAASPDPGGTFVDDDDSVHQGTIEAITAEGITLGCNPPDYDEYCPDSAVTRGQMASFLVRAYGLPAADWDFTDTADSVHAANIGALAAAGITLGCNPPDYDRFCPDNRVTRGQMATFLVRAEGLPAADWDFIDTADSVHAANIAALAAAGITLGCNPPDYDRFCPDDAVTRAQMASFLARALDLDPIDPPPRLPEESPSSLVVIGADNWLFHAGNATQNPIEASVYARTAVEIANAEAVVTATGRSFVYAIAPNKTVMYGDTHLPGWTGSGADANSNRLRDALDAAGHASRVDLWVPLGAVPTQIYFKHDTHWNGAGALIVAEEMAELAAPGLWSGFDLQAHDWVRDGDLAAAIGIEWPIEDVEYRVTVPGVDPVVTVTDDAVAGRPVVVYESGSDPDLSPDATTVIHDSFGFSLRDLLGPMFDATAFVPYFSNPMSDEVRPYLLDGDQIVLEVSERNVVGDFVADGFAGELAAVFADEFTQTAVGYTADSASVSFSIPAGSGLRYLIVEASVAAPVSIGDPTDIRPATDEGAWIDTIQPDISRYGFEIMDNGEHTLDLSLPSSVTVDAAYVIVIE